MPRFTRAELESYRGAVVPDLVAPDMRLLFVGINPGLLTAARQVHFGNPSSRFRPALVASGLLGPAPAGQPGMTAADLATLSARGIGITNLVPFATARADELTRAQLEAGHSRLEDFVSEHRPRVVAVLGITAYRTAFRRPGATAGPQPEPIGEAELWVVPNPSGVNAHESVASLAAAYAEPVHAAGIELSATPPTIAP